MGFLGGAGQVGHSAGDQLAEYSAAGKSVVDLGNELKPLVADFARDGVDLVLSNEGGDYITINDYFASFPSPELVADGGARLTSDVVSRLAGPGPQAQSTFSQTDESPIGAVTELSGSVSIKHTDGTSESAVEGSQVYKGDVLETANDGNFAITFVDDTLFSMGPSGRAVLDDLIFNLEDTSANGMGVSLLQGVFSFVSGQIAKDNPESVTIKTPVGTIGIRGTAWSGKIAQLGEESLFTLFTGAIIVTNEGGSQLLTVSQQSVIVTSFAIAPGKPFILSEEQLIDAYGKVLSLINPEWLEDDEDFDPSKINPEAGPGGPNGGGGGAGFANVDLASLGDGLGLAGILDLSDLLDRTELEEGELRALLGLAPLGEDPLIEVRVKTVIDPETSTVSAFSIEVILDAPTDVPVTIYYEVLPGTATGVDMGMPGDVDFVDEGGGVIILLPGTTSNSFSITLVDDDVIEDTEFFFIRLTGAENATIDPLSDMALIVIEDNDVGVISVRPVLDDGPSLMAFGVAPFALLAEVDPINETSVDETVGTVQFRLVLDKAVAPGVEVRVDYTVTGDAVDRTDFPEGDVLSAFFSGGDTGLPAGSEIIIEISILDDDQYQGDESFSVNLVGGTLNAVPDEIDGTLQVTIIDDETPIIAGQAEVANISESEIDDSADDVSLALSGGSGTYSDLVFAGDQLGYDALALTSGGVAVELVGLGTGSLLGMAGDIEIFSVTLNSDGSYDVTLSGALDHIPGVGITDTGLFFPLNFEATDTNGSFISSQIYVTIRDDDPLAVSETDSVVEGHIATGNILTGLEVLGDNNATDGTADIAGADGMSLFGAWLVGGESGLQLPDDGGVITVVGSYGTLTVQSDGSYAYQANDGLDNTAPLTDEFGYKIIDDDGDESSAVLSINLFDGLTPDIGAIAHVFLDEDDLPEGGDVSKESLTAGAEVPISFNGDAPGTVMLDISALPEIQSRGDDVEYSIETLDDGVTLRVSAISVPEEGAPRTVFVLDFAPNGTGDNYAYSATLLDVIDHGGAGEDSASFVFGITVEDQDGATETSSFTFSIIDDIPVAFDDAVTVVTVPVPNYNLLFVLDSSGSMNQTVPQEIGDNKTRMTILREAVTELLAGYAESGDAFNITFIDFDSQSHQVFSSTSIADAQAFINDDSNFFPSGVTNYAAALADTEDGAQGVLTEHLSDPDLAGYSNIVYFISDGEPFPGGNGVPIGGDFENFWQIFVDENAIEVVAIGIGDDLDTTQLNRVENEGDEAEVVSDANDLESALLASIPEVKEGNVVSSGIVDKLGADGASATTLAFRTESAALAAAYGIAGASVIELDEELFSVVFDIPQNGDALEISLDSGSIFSISMDGEYVFEAVAGIPAGVTHAFEYTLTDGDGDTSDATLTFTFVNDGDAIVVAVNTGAVGENVMGDGLANALVGTSGNDVMDGGAGDDTLSGGGGDDTLTGGEGADLFVITEDDTGQIIIADFDVSEDIVDLDNLFDALSLDVDDRGEGDAWSLDIVSGVATLNIAGLHTPTIIFDGYFDPNAEDLSALAAQIVVSDES